MPLSPSVDSTPEPEEDNNRRYPENHTFAKPISNPRATYFQNMEDSDIKGIGDYHKHEKTLQTSSNNENEVTLDEYSLSHHGVSNQDSSLNSKYIAQGSSTISQHNQLNLNTQHTFRRFEEVADRVS